MLKFPSGHTGDDLMSLWFAFVGLRSLEDNPVEAIAVAKGTSMYHGVRARG